MRTWLDPLYKALGVLGALFLLATLVIEVVNIAGRQFGFSMAGVDAYAGYTLAAGSFLAGLAGGLTAPFGNVNYTLDTTVIVMAFIVVVIGGMGNLYGALAAALAVGVIKGLGVLFFPRLSMVLIFLIMAAVLAVRSLGRQAVSK